MESQHIKIKSSASLLETINHLERLIASLKEGTIFIQRNDESISLRPQDPVTFELEAESKLEKDSLREKLYIELKWKKMEAIPEAVETFVISSGAPVKKEGCEGTKSKQKGPHKEVA